MSYRNYYLSSLLWAFADEFSENSNKINTNFINLVNLINVKFKLNLKEDGNKVDFKLLSETYSNSFHNPLIGDIIVFNGRYKREFSNHSKLGHGGFGIVYKANNNFDEQIYAIKRQSFQKKYLKDENLETYNKMYKEIKLIAKLKNNFLLSYKSAWFEFCDLELFIQMDFYPLTLKYAIDEMKLDRKENSIVIYYISCELFQEILEGVNYLHSSTPPLIHRDLKPSNILITYGENGTFIKIADFGLATFHEHSNQSHTGKVGSNGYIAPEVTTNRKYDIKADMFSLGIIVLELFDISKIKSTNDKMNQTKFNYIDNLSKNLTNLEPDQRHSCSSIMIDAEKWRIFLNDLVKLGSIAEFDSNDIMHDDINKDFIKYFLAIKKKSHKMPLSKSEVNLPDKSLLDATSSVTVQSLTPSTSLGSENSNDTKDLQTFRSREEKVGSSRKEAENNAAESLINILNEHFKLQFKFDKDKSMKQQLNELYTKMDWKNAPEYEEILKTGPPHEPKFTYRATIKILTSLNK